MLNVVKDKCLSGNVIDVTVKIKGGTHTGKRTERKNVTREAVRKNNYRLAVKRLARAINANFNQGDLSLVITYDDEHKPQGKTEAQKSVSKFLAALKYHCTKIGHTLKYIYVTEGIRSGKRIHHHIIVNLQDLALINKLWKYGYVRATALDDSGDYTKLAEYLMKEQSDEVSAHRYHGSRNLIHPKVKRTDCNIEELDADPKAEPGYYIPKDSIRRYEHPVTGLPILEYRMVKLPDTKGKRYLRGRTVRETENYKPNYEEEQDSFLDWEEWI